MLQYDFEDSVGCWIAGTSHALRRAMDVELAKEGITFRQWEVLAWLSFGGNQTQATLSDRIGIEAPTLAGVISRMERDGWLKREQCPNDGRKKYVCPTEQAEAVWERMVKCCHEIRAKATRGIPAEHLEILKSTCASIRENLGWQLESFLNPNCKTVAAGCDNGQV